MISSLPTVNASLNALAALLLLAGFVAIRSGKRELHRKLMLAAFSCSVLFLVCYLVYHAQAGSKRFPGTGTVRAFYLAVLASHSVLAALLPFGAILALRRALQGKLEQHRRLTRWVWPVWMYVSVTGVVIYWMLYRMSWGP
ncbi:DUF420 domain-containing protein [bacterium CPR1]|nr:DUF420 domain-containing protein [bacterium CPR1]